MTRHRLSLLRIREQAGVLRFVADLQPAAVRRAWAKRLGIFGEAVR